MVIIEGAKGVREVFGDAARIQRCQWYKREAASTFRFMRGGWWTI